MKHFIEIKVPETTRNHVDKTTCDICGLKIIGPDDDYKIDEIDISRRTGTNYPEGGSGEELSIDLCGSCFDSHLIPLIKAAGGKPTVTEWDW